MRITNVLTRIYLDPEELDKAISFYEDIFGEKCRLRLKYARVEIASIGKMLLTAGPEEALKPYREMRTIFVVDSLNNFKDKLVQSKAVILNEPKQLPTGMNMVVKHPDGAVIEYVELQS